jgi:hypothetical protein
MKRCGSMLVISLFLAAAPAGPDVHGGCRSVQGLSSQWLYCPSDLTALPLQEKASALLSGEQWEALWAGAGEAAGGAAQGRGRAPGDPTFSWHDVGGLDWMTRVRSQGTCGACFVFASVASIEGMVKWLIRDPNLEIDLSEQSVIACISMGSCDSGGYAEEVGHHIKTEGITDERCYPYIQADGRCSDLCADHADRTSRITDWHMSILPWDDDEIKAQLSVGPMVVDMKVYEDLYGYSSGVYSRSASAAELGWHSVTLVGWDDSDFSWIVKNSWGSAWGDGGYFKISRAEDCNLLFTEGTCFASHLTYFDVTEADAPGAPCLDENEIFLSAEQGQVARRMLNVTNCGRAYPIDWTGYNYDTAWLSWVPSGGTLAVGESEPFDVVADTTGLAPGLHEGVLAVIGGAGYNWVWVDLEVIESVTADFTADPVSGPVPLEVTFQPVTTGPVTSWQWHFGDGGVSTESAPVHVYESLGSFTVTLTVEADDGRGDGRTREDYILVTERVPDEADAGRDAADDGAWADTEDGEGENGPVEAGGCGCSAANVELFP